MNTTFLSGSIFLKAFVFITFFGLFSMTASGSMRINVPDSIGVENVNNKQVILHQLEPKETYYGLSRQYDVPLQDLIQFNNNKPLKIGEIIRVPTSRPVLSASEIAAQAASRDAEREVAAAETTTHVPHVQLAPGEYTVYIVSKGETLFNVSRRFGVPVESIKLANGLANDSIREGQNLQVPKQPIALPVEAIEEPIVTASSVIDTLSSSDTAFELPKNRYGIREVTQKGTGVWIEDLNQDGASMLALHNTAPVGTVVKVTNPMTNLSTFVKVVGKFVENADTQGSLIVLSKSVASIIGILDRRFQVEIAYGAPVEE
ncbi:MAG TPA: LysM peptidoglycan-binding domain-containing protein [Sphingobacteriaceae bacterium]|nr:LysM peptidoglycan-binding domain-containing protein [Sphingobacteriaceae bacterium]